MKFFIVYNQFMNITQEFETITAIATPLGTGGVGIVRISGDSSFEIIRKISKLKDITPGKIHHTWIVDNGQLIDEVVVLPFKNPHSFTGEDVIEIQCHGGVQVIKNILGVVLHNGARMAQKGEFTKRAFLNKKIDLSQAEAIGDLIHATNSQFARKSANNLSGVLRQRIEQIREQLFEVSSRIVAGIDFPEDVSEPEYDYLIKSFENAIKEIDKILNCAKSSDILRQGLEVAIVGRPNVGKSSVFNELLNVDRAIVTDIAGTTRDIIKENLDLGVNVTLADTAGIRDDAQADKVEQIGIEYSKQSAQNSDFVIFVYDSSIGLTPEDLEIYNSISDKKHIVVANKIDLSPDFKEEIKYTLTVSTLNHQGIDILREKIKDVTSSFDVDDIEFVTNSRQQSCLISSKKALQSALEGAKAFQIQDMIYIDLKSALLALGELTGEVVTEDILDNIFSHFCIGK